MVECPAGCDGMVFGRTIGLAQVVVHPRTMSSFSGAVVEIDTLSPGTGIEHLVGIGIADVAVEDVLCHGA